MSRYTETTEIAFNALRHSRVVCAEIEDVVVNQWNGSSYVPTDTVIDADTSEEITTRGLKLQFVVISGGAVNIEEGLGT